jgi:hypothetical protein
MYVYKVVPGLGWLGGFVAPFVAVSGPRPLANPLWGPLWSSGGTTEQQ